MDSGIDGSKASRLAKQYFEELYGLMGVLVFEIENVSYNPDQKAWIVDCSFFRTLVTDRKSSYQVVIYSDGKIGPISKQDE